MNWLISSKMAYICPVHETYKGKADGTFRGGQGVAQLDPVVMVSAMASVTKSVGFGLTGSTTYIHVHDASTNRQS
jgi:alkanesulfonate monooxygenase SsuD/methylene tetrahydromethanopterin reductase-like flavin-dependent oxidoreductase (luciferase family)